MKTLVSQNMRRKSEQPVPLNQLKKLQEPTSIVIQEFFQLLKEKIEEINPTVIGFTVPFPGNLYSALRGAQFIRTNYPKITIFFGGGYCNTELRSLKDPSIFKYLDYILLDDGEAPLEQLIKYLNNEITQNELIRTFYLKSES